MVGSRGRRGARDRARSRAPATQTGARSCPCVGGLGCPAVSSARSGPLPHYTARPSRLTPTRLGPAQPTGPARLSSAFAARSGFAVAKILILAGGAAGSALDRGRRPRPRQPPPPSVGSGGRSAGRGRGDTRNVAWPALGGTVAVGAADTGRVLVSVLGRRRGLMPRREGLVPRSPQYKIQFHSPLPQPSYSKRASLQQFDLCLSSPPSM